MNPTSLATHEPFESISLQGQTAPALATESQVPNSPVEPTVEAISPAAPENVISLTTIVGEHAKIVAQVQGPDTPAEPAAVELSPEQKFMETLKVRYEKNERNIACHNEVKWEVIEARLNAKPEALKGLKEMEDSEGFPDVTGVEGDKVLFDEMPKVMPSHRRLTHAKAVQKIGQWGGGVKLMHPNRFKKLINDQKINLAQFYYVWLDTSDQPDLLNDRTHFPEGLAKIGSFNGKEAYIGQGDASLEETIGFLCSLEV